MQHLFEKLRDDTRILRETFASNEKCARTNRCISEEFYQDVESVVAELRHEVYDKQK